MKSSTNHQGAAALAGIILTIVAAFFVGIPSDLSVESVSVFRNEVSTFSGMVMLPIMIVWVGVAVLKGDV